MTTTYDDRRELLLTARELTPEAAAYLCVPPQGTTKTTASAFWQAWWPLSL